MKKIYDAFLIALLLLVVACTRVEVGSGVEVCSGGDGTTECSDAHDESDNSDNSNHSDNSDNSS
jgi:hypothetical protein